MDSDAIAYGLASFILPGLGQFLKGDKRKGIIFFAILLILNAFTYYLMNNHFGHLIGTLYRLYAGYDIYKTIQAS